MSRQSIVGVIELGYPTRGAGVPEDAHQPLSIVLGDSVTLDMIVLDSTGAPVDLSATTRNVLLTVKVRTSDVVTVLSQNATKQPALGPNRCQFSFSEEDLFCLSQPRYVYDVWLIDDDGGSPTPAIVARQVLVPLSLFRVEGAVAR